MDSSSKTAPNHLLNNPLLIYVFLIISVRCPIKTTVVGILGWQNLNQSHTQSWSYIVLKPMEENKMMLFTDLYIYRHTNRVLQKASCLPAKETAPGKKIKDSRKNKTHYTEINRTVWIKSNGNVLMLEYKDTKLNVVSSLASVLAIRKQTLKLRL